MSLTFPAHSRSGSKLTPETVRLIADMASNGIAHKGIADLYGVSVQTVSDIATGKRWKGVSGVQPQKRIQRLTPDERGEILRLRSEGMPPVEIAVAVGRSFATVHRVISHAKNAPE